MKIITANVNGIRSASKKGIWDFLKKENADIICLQELKAQEQDLTEVLKNPLQLHRVWHCAQKRGYSGVAIYSKETPKKITYGIGDEQFDAEGRFVQVDFADFSVVSLYLPSGSSSDERQAFKFKYLEQFKVNLASLLLQKNMVICGDWNIAHQNIDLKNWKANQKNSGFLPEERQWLTEIINTGWKDVWRTLYPELPGYTWWSNRGQAYAKDVGWRIDYQMANFGMAEAAVNASVYKEVKFSDHAPLIVNYNLG